MGALLVPTSNPAHSRPGVRRKSPAFTGSRTKDFRRHRLLGERHGVFINTNFSVLHPGFAQAKQPNFSASSFPNTPMHSVNSPMYHQPQTPQFHPTTAFEVEQHPVAHPNGSFTRTVPISHSTSRPNLQEEQLMAALNSYQQQSRPSAAPNTSSHAMFAAQDAQQHQQQRMSQFGGQPPTSTNFAQSSGMGAHGSSESIIFTN